MTLSPALLNGLMQCAVNAACTAGRVIAARTVEPPTARQKEGGVSLASQVVTEVDLLCEAAIVRELQASCECHAIGLLTEEGEDAGSRLECDHFWCVDPLDGTLAFIESSPGYAVSIALVTRTGEPLIGVVLDPLTGVLYTASKGQGAYRNGAPWRLVDRETWADAPLTLVCDRSLVSQPDYPELLAEIEALAVRFGLAGVRTLHNGGAVMNACWVVEQAPALYFKRPKAQIGGGSLWDFAATACLFHELGAIASDFHGAPLDLNRAASTFMNHRGVIYASHAELVEGFMQLAWPHRA